MQNLVHVDDDRADKDEEVLTYARSTVWGTLYTEHPDLVSKSALEVAKIITSHCGRLRQKVLRLRKAKRKGFGYEN